MKNFYSEIPSFTKFDDCVEISNYHQAPGEWIVLLTDIRGSTAAIQNGRYQDVNLAGASAISAVLNTAKGYDLPYQFGGDGATILIPPELESKLRLEMARLKTFISAKFNLDLRVGFVPITELENQGHRVMVARYEMSPGNFLAMFGESGVRIAEDLVKGVNGKKYQIDAAQNGELPNLEGLSCRWKPLESRGGVTVTLLISAAERANSSQILKRVLDSLNRVVDGSLETSRPTQKESLKARWLPKNLKFEADGHKRVSRGQPAWIMIQSIAVRLSMTFRFKIGPMNPVRYLKELELNTDYRKFDNMLRLVLACTPEQAKSIETTLVEYQANGDIDFGLHASEEALMTCLVFSLDEGKHVHFVDGANGGYAMAAHSLKNQIYSRTRVSA